MHQYVIDPPEEFREAFAQAKPAILEGMKKEIKEGEDILRELGSRCDAAALFVAVAVQLSMSAPGSRTEAEFGTFPMQLEQLAFILAPMFDNGKPLPSPFDTTRCLEVLESMVRARTVVLFETHIGNDPTPTDRLAGGLATETRIIRGSAYPPQIREQIEGIQGRFDRWFETEAGLAASRASDLVWQILRAFEHKHNQWWQNERIAARDAGMAEWVAASNTPEDVRTDCQRWLSGTFANEKEAGTFYAIASLLENASSHAVDRTDIIGMSPPPTAREWDALIQLLGLTPERLAKMKEPADVRNYPLLVYPGGKCQVYEISHTLDMLQIRIEEQARKGGSFYDTYQEHRAGWVEVRVEQYLKRLFPASKVFRGLLYPDPHHPGNEAELDLLVVYGPLVIVAEVKARQFRLLVSPDHRRNLRKDLQANIEAPWKQAERAVEYINSSEKPHFRRAESGKLVEIEMSEIRRVYPLSISQHLLAGVTNDLRKLTSLGLFKEGQFPFATCLADLDIFTRFCPGPEALLHYMERRNAFLKAQVHLDGRTVDLFGAYLDHRLLPELYKAEGKEMKNIAFNGFGDVFDKWMLWYVGDLENEPEVKLNVPTWVGDVLAELRSRGDNNAIWISFALLDLSSELLNRLSNIVLELRSQMAVPGYVRWAEVCQGDVCLVVVCTDKCSLEYLRDRTAMLTEVRKYVSKAKYGVGIGFHLHDTARTFHTAIWMEGAWEYDPQVEKLLHRQPTAIPPPGTTRPGRNQPCFCGSGKKFKKCCLPHRG